MRSWTADELKLGRQFSSVLFQLQQVLKDQKDSELLEVQLNSVLPHPLDQWRLMLHYHGEADESFIVVGVPSEVRWPNVAELLGTTVGHWGPLLVVDAAIQVGITPDMGHNHWGRRSVGVPVRAVLADLLWVQRRPTGTQIQGLAKIFREAVSKRVRFLTRVQYPGGKELTPGWTIAQGVVSGVEDESLLVVAQGPGITQWYDFADMHPEGVEINP